MSFRDQVTWPYLAKEVDDSLDPDLIERHGREILARATIHGRLVAFLGAGVSMAYGRLSWMQLVKRTLTAVEAIDADMYSQFDEIGSGIQTRLGTLQQKLRLIELQSNGINTGRRLPKPEENRPLLILQLCSDVLELASRGEELLKRMNPAHEMKHKTLPEIYSEALSDSRVHDEAVRDAKKLFGPRSPSSNATGAGSVNTRLNRLAKTLSPKDAKQLPSRRHFLGVLAGVTTLSKTPGGRSDSTHDNGYDSPIALLMHDLKVHRFATTNYDIEIERALQAAQARPESRDADPQAPAERLSGPTDIHFGSFSLLPETTAAAIAFSVEGRRRHAAVMHLHGSVTDAKTMIASERDYQVRYLRNSPQRDLLDNAIRTLFGANPVLYVGSGISEDDVLRPLREFMSLALRRADSLGVALLPANEDEPQLALRKIECLVRYGIHVIHYGYANKSARTRKGVAWNKPRGKSWLCEFTSAVRALKARLTILNDEDHDAREKSLNRLDPVRQTFKRPFVMDGQDCQPVGSGPRDKARAAAIEIDLECELLSALIQDYGSSKQEISKEAHDRICVLLDELSASVTTAFICARLLTEVDFRHQWELQLTRPIDPVVTRNPIRLAGDPDLESGELEQLVYRHMTIDLCHRFAPEKANGPAYAAPSDPRWQHFLGSLDLHKRFLTSRTRRMILLPVPRGAGKGSMFDQLTTPNSATLKIIQQRLSWQGAGNDRWRTGVISLNFLSDISNIADVIARIIWSRRYPSGQPQSAGPDADPISNNVMAKLEQSLDACVNNRSRDEGARDRIMLVLANVGVLFGSDGREKNGQVRRLLRLLMSRRYANAPIDFIVFCDEAHVPWQFRVGGDNSLPADGAGRTARRVDAAYMGEDYERVNRLAMHGIVPPDLKSKRLLIHPPARSLAREVAKPFLRNLASWEEDGRLMGPMQALDPALKRLHRAVAGNRIAMTLVFALCDEARRSMVSGAIDDPAAKKDFKAAEQFLDEVTATMAAHIHESAPETAIQYVFDRWSLLHLRQPEILKANDVSKVLGAPRYGKGRRLAKSLWSRPDSAERLWKFSIEILWHLAVFSHPVELAVLAQCPGIRQHAELWLAKPGESANNDAVCALIEAVLELCVFRCLAMRIRRRQREDDPDRPEQRRYTVHRMVQRYFIRMIGGRNIEGIEWDQFTTSLYASQPDEIPALSAEAHAKIKALIKALSRYGYSPDYPSRWVPGRRVEEFQALRAAYFVARSTYSVGVLSHIASQSHTAGTMPDHGHMEEYRRMIRWITHRAQSLQDTGDKTGYFHRGEIVWLYAECGVMSLTQGKLEDAESLLNLSLQAARRVECDDTGSLHVRLLLHVALTRIERGRPRAARRILEPITQRQGGHDVPPLIAEFYLGMIEHLGGEYHSAHARYEKALTGFRFHNRTRAAAFVLKSEADLHVARHPEKLEEAIALAQEAMSLAQRGGHEDVRMLAILTLVRLRSKRKGDQSNSDSYRLLELAGKYASDMGMPRIQVAVHEVRAAVLLSQGETNLSAREATTSAEIAALYDLRLFKAKALLTLAQIYKQRNETHQAKDLIRTGLEMAHASEYFSCVRGFRALETMLSVSPATTSVRSAEVDASNRAVGSTAASPIAM